MKCETLQSSYIKQSPPSRNANLSVNFLSNDFIYCIYRIFPFSTQNENCKCVKDEQMKEVFSIFEKLPKSLSIALSFHDL